MTLEKKGEIPCRAFPVNFASDAKSGDRLQGWAQGGLKCLERAKKGGWLRGFYCDWDGTELRWKPVSFEYPAGAKGKSTEAFLLACPDVAPGIGEVIPQSC